MASSGIVRWGAIGFMLGGVIWVVLGPFALGRLPASDPQSRRRRAVRRGAPALGGGAGRAPCLAERRLRTPGTGFYLALAAMAARAFGAVVFLAGSSALEWISFPATLGMLVGFVLYGVATLRARVLPRWYGVALIVSLPISLPLAVYGTVLFGLFLVTLGCVLWMRRDATIE